MATSGEFLAYIQDQCIGLDVRFRAMMGEYVLYYCDRVAGGLYDNRLLVKNMPSARALLPDAPLELPYEGAQEMILVECTDDRPLLAKLLDAMYPELPAPRQRKVKRHD